MELKWRPPATPAELDSFVDMIVEGKYALEPPIRLLVCTNFKKGDIDDKLKRTDDNSKRVNLVMLYFPYSRFRKMMRRMDTVLLKNEAVLNILEAKGDAFHKSKDLVKAIRCYTLALSFAPKESPATVYIYTKRAAIFIDLEKYDLAYMDTEMALRNCKMSVAVQVRLYGQKENCKALIAPKIKGEDDLVREEFIDQTITRVQGQDDSQASVLPDFISVEYHPYKGRYLVTKIDLDPGTTVLVEEPFVAVPMNHLKWQSSKCHYCLRKTQNPIPCNGCVFFTYCGEKCRDDDFRHGHMFECPLLPLAHSMKMYDIEQMSLKSLCKAGPKALKRLYDKSKSLNQVEDAWFVPVNATKENCDQHSQVLNMASHNRTCDLPHSVIMAVSVAYALRIKTKFFDNIKDSEKLGFEKFVATVFLHHTESFPYNVVGLSPTETEIYDIPTYLDDVDGRRDTQVASGMFPLISLLNHSCDASIFRQHLPGGRVAILTNRKLKAGEELTHSYGFDFLIMPLKERRNDLIEYYRINCDCTACKEDWPVLSDMQHTRKSACPMCRSNIRFLMCSSSSLNEIQDAFLKCEGCYGKSKSKRWANAEPCNPYVVILEIAEGLVLNNKPLEAIPLLKDCIKNFQEDPGQPSLQMAKAQGVLVDAFDLIMNTVTEDKELNQEKEKSSKIRNLMKKYCSIM